MAQTQKTHTIIGYRYGEIPPGANTFLATARIDGVEITHQLSICVEPATAIDVGRSSDGDVVWVSEVVDPVAVPVRPSIFLPQEFTPITPEPAGDSRAEATQWETQRKRFSLVGAYKKPALFAAGALVIMVGIGGFLPSISAQSHTKEEPAGSAEKTAEFTDPQASESKPIDPASAAIDFVVNGQVTGVEVEPGTRTSDFTANVVSQSGEIVLVDVLRNEANGLTTFATLLLQKSGTAWRIREVFDPR